MSGIPRIGLNPSALRKTRPREYALRFLFGGIITAIVGVIAKAFGPAAGGLFLAFPAILPASLTLVEKHDGAKKVGSAAAGAAIGSVGLLIFGLAVWRLASPLPGYAALLLAVLAWFVTSTALWIALCLVHSSLVDHSSESPVESDGAVGRGQVVRQRTLDPRS